MKFKARELLLMTLPIALLGGVGWWRSRISFEEAPPENVMQGKPRLVVGQWHTVAPSPFDLYRGYERKLEVSLWSAGQIPPPRTTKGAKSLSVSRDIALGFPTPDVFYHVRGHNQWQKLNSTFDNPSVLIEFVPVSHQMGERMVVPLLVRLPHAKNVDGVRLQGRLDVRVDDREEFDAGSYISGIITGTRDLLSSPVERKISLNGKARAQQMNSLIRVSPLRLKSLMRSRFAPSSTDIQLDVTAQNDQDLPPQVTIRLDGGRLLDPRGKEVAKVSNYGLGMDKNEVTITPVFPKVPRKYLNNRAPLVFQGALSLNGCWPVEINRVVPGLPDQESRPSILPFQR